MRRSDELKPEVSELVHEVREGLLADTHEHTFSEATYVSQPPDVLRDLFWGYAASDLIIAGADRDAVYELVRGPADAIGRRFEGIQAAWERCIHTGYGEGVRLTARTLYGIEHLSPASLEAARPRSEELRRPGQRLHLLKDTARLAYVQIDDLRRECIPDPHAPEFFMSDISVADLVCGSLDGRFWESGVGDDNDAQHESEIRDLGALEQLVHLSIAPNAATAVALKTQHAYYRELRWTRRDPDDVTRALKRRERGAALAGDATVIGDWCLSLVAEHAAAYNLPLKIHTGAVAGTGYMDPERLSPSQLADFARQHPRTTLVLMHGGFPHVGETFSLAKHYPSVHVDLCWAWSLDPRRAERALRDAIHSVPINKVLAFGGDSFWPAMSVGYALQAREWLLRALTGEVLDGQLSASAARAVAYRLMLGNAEELFDVSAKQQSLRRALGELPTSEGPGVIGIPQVIEPERGASDAHR